MIRLTPTMLRAAAAATALSVLTGIAHAQGSPPIPSMPLPPSASEPTPKEAGKAKPKKTTSRKAEGGSGVGSGTPGRSGSASTYERSNQFVPEEFDRGRGSNGSVKPFVSESGRPGMGMRF